MFDALSPAEISLLRQLAQRGSPTAEARLDGEALRTLAHRRFLKRLSGFAVITPEGKKALEALARGQEPATSAHPAFAALEPVVPAAPEEPASEDGEVTVNSTQEEMIRLLVQSSSPVPFDDLDGRVVRALEGRGLVSRTDGLVSLTDAGRAFYDSKVRRRRRARSGWMHTATPAPARQGEEPAREDDRGARARSIREAVDMLRRAIGDGVEEIGVGDLSASADEAYDALLELADRIERGSDPRRIPRR